MKNKRITTLAFTLIMPIAVAILLGYPTFIKAQPATPPVMGQPVVPAGQQPAQAAQPAGPAGQNCTTDILTGVPNGIDWNEVFMLRGADGSAWQRGIISNGGGELLLNEFSINNIHGIAEAGADVQVFIFAPQDAGEGRMAKPDQATCFMADTMWRTTEGERNVQIHAGYFSLPMSPRVLWPNIGQDIVLDAFFKRQESWDTLMADGRYQQAQNFYIGSQLKPTVLEVTGTRDDAKLKCKLLCDKGPAIGVELNPAAVPKKAKGVLNSFDTLEGKSVTIGRMPGIHTFYAGFKDGAATQADKPTLRLLAHQAMGMEAFKRAVLGNRNARGRPPGIPYISATTLEDAVTGRNPNIPLDTVMLIRSAARMLIEGRADGPAPLVPYPDMTTREQPGFNIFNPGATVQTPTPVTGQLGATPVATILPVGVTTPPPSNVIPGVPSLPRFTPNLNAPNSLYLNVPNSILESEFLGYMVPPPVPDIPLNYANQVANPIQVLDLLPLPPTIPAPHPVQSPPPQTSTQPNPLPGTQPNPGIPASGITFPGAPPPPPSLPVSPPQANPGGTVPGAVDYPVESPVGVPNIPTRPIAAPPGRSIFDGVRRDASQKVVDGIVNRGNSPNIPAMLFPTISTEATWAADMVQLITFWTGSLKVNPCLLADDTFLAEDFLDQSPAFAARSCQNYIYVSGLTPRLVLRSNESMRLRPDFKDATITKTDEPFTENNAWILPEGKKKIRQYLYEFTAKFPETRVGESCIRGSELPKFITTLENGLSLDASETIALSQELHEQVTQSDTFYRLRLADPQDVAARLVWLDNDKKLDLVRLFFEVQKGACDTTAISVPNIEVPADRDGFEAGIIK